MKNAHSAAFLLLVGLLAAPLTGALPRAALPDVSQVQTPSVPTVPSTDISALLAMLQTVSAPQNADSSATEAAGEGNYRVLLHETGRIVTLTPKDYLRGCVAAEMPLEYDDEAVKAQIVAAHTYAVSYKLRQLSAPSDELKGADLSDDPASGQAYITDAEIAARYPDDYQIHIARLNRLIDQVGDYIMVYEGEPVVAAYHAISAGKTESAQNIWGAYSPYLVAVNSKDDKTAPDYRSTVTFTVAKMRALLAQAGITPEGSAKNWFSDLLKTPSGYVSAVSFGSGSLTGTQLRNLLGLRSACFTVDYASAVFTFEVYGWGHGVGMSQYGAQCLAQDGKNYLDILKTYYKGIEFCEL
ncbi:MAG: stage II sporulation protein D [Clostridia bacterium]|nr:stage II sporulation protein D [Clostridia bacterium]